MAETKVALITGGSSGIGLAAARGLLDCGFTVALAARNSERLDRAAAELEAGDNVRIQAADVGDPDRAAGLVEEVVEHHGRLDVLVNNAGAVFNKPLAEHTIEDWRATIDVNTTSVLATTRAAWPTFKHQKSGVVINISSMAAKDPFPGLGVYGAAKAAVNMLTLVTAREGAKLGIKAVAIGPGAVETPMLRSIFSEKQVPASAALSPEKVAELVCACATGERSFKPGEVIYITR